jgi:hypothetical protein
VAAPAQEVGCRPRKYRLIIDDQYLSHRELLPWYETAEEGFELWSPPLVGSRR